MKVSILSLSFTKPNYGAMRSDNSDSDCSAMNKKICESTVVGFLYPFRYEVKGSSNNHDCWYSCPFPDDNTEFRGSMCCLTMVGLILVLFFLWKGWLDDFQIRGYILQFMTCLGAAFWFSIFVLDCQATRLGLEFCEGGFKVENSDGTTTQLVESKEILDCDSSSFAGLAVFDLILSISLIILFGLCRKYRFATMDDPLGSKGDSRSSKFNGQNPGAKSGYPPAESNMSTFSQPAQPPQPLPPNPPPPPAGGTAPPDDNTPEWLK